MRNFHRKYGEETVKCKKHNLGNLESLSNSSTSMCSLKAVLKHSVEVLINGLVDDGNGKGEGRC